MKLFAVIAAALLLPGAVSAQVLAVDRDKAWFKPALLTDQAPVCADILRVEQDAFFSTAIRSNHERAGFKLIRKMYEEPVPDPQVELIPDSFGQLLLTLPGQQRVVAYFHNGGGCGGACEHEQVMLADKVFDPVPSRGHDLPATPLAPGWTLYKSTDGEFYALGHDDGNLKAYRVAPSLRMELACEVQLRPGDQSKADASVQRASQAMQAFLSTLAAMSQDAGTCGSLNAHQTRSRLAAEASHQILYRPWASWEESDVSNELSNDTDSLSQGRNVTDHYLRQWALFGVTERRAFAQYQQQYALTAADLSKFYRQQFGWPEARADDAAAQALRWVLHRAFAFSSSFNRFGRDQLLRQAILERAPIDEIDAQYQARTRDTKSIVTYQKASQYDSLLNAAIEYPEALRYLLSKGFDPNEPNGFGKTPLMYAAQYDQIESARVLLAAGADPNAATFLPEDTCFYTLRSSGVTALHYAARYASAPMIQLLVSNGAATFNMMRWHDSETEASPLDWLNSYAGASPPSLKKLLRMPDDEDRAQLSASFVARAREEYARGDFKPAYRHLRVALNAQPDNAKALADWPLMAFKAGDISAALRAATVGIESMVSPQLQASAWFNMGLICEAAEIREGYFRGGECNRDWIWPFVQALKLQPTRARADRLQQIFNREDVGSCSPAGLPNDRKLLSIRAGLYEWALVERFYILHSADEQMNIEVAPGVSRIIDAMPVRDLALTVLDAPTGSALPRVNGQLCRLPSAEADVVR